MNIYEQCKYKNLLKETNIWSCMEDGSVKWCYKLNRLVQGNSLQMKDSSTGAK